MRFADNTTIYIPTKYIGMLSSKVGAMISDITRDLGGCTITEARGQYVNNAGEMEVERISMVQWWHNGTTSTTSEKMQGLTKYLLEVCGEESVFVTEQIEELNGDTYINAYTVTLTDWEWVR
jgi:hypothetical protein